MGRPLKMGGSAWQYLVDAVAGEVGQGADAARYYASTGTPPGRFLGRGLDGLGPSQGSVKEGDVVSPVMLHRMLAQLADPVTGKPLGRLSVGKRSPVAGFDMTFSPPKSVSLMWAMGDQATRAAIEEVLARGASEVITWAEDHVFRTRTGAQGARQEAVRGVVASSWLHYESRLGDCQLHHHCVVLNRAQARSDIAWRTLDSKALHAWVVALSERHTGIVEDLMTERFGVAWREVPAIAGRVAKREVDGVPPDLVAEFSRRTMAIEEVTAQKVSEQEAVRGRPLTSNELGVLHRAAWRETRPKKAHRPLQEMTADWVERARPWVGEEPTSWVAGLAGRSDLPALRSDDLTDAMLRDLARAALAARSERSSVFTQANVYADAERQLHGVLFAPGERAKVSERAADIALSMAVKLSPPELSHVPERFRAPDATSQFAPATSWQYTTAELLEAEARLLDAGRETSGPAVSYGTVARVCDRPLPGRALEMGQDQAVAVEQVATSGRVCDVLVGPAGTGKTVALSGLLAAWEAEHGLGSVRGLAPSAAAAVNLSDELGIPTENTAKWLSEVDREPERLAEVARLRALAAQLPPTAARSVEQRAAELEAEARRWQFAPGDLLLVDEASLAGTFALDRLVAQARQAGAKILLVGDTAQLGAVGAGGAFGMLAGDRQSPPELVEARRFSEEWERRASAELRAGSPRGVDAYISHGRVLEGDRAEVLSACYEAWKADVEAGRSSLMVAHDNETVRELNRLARADRVAAGKVAEEGFALADGSVAGAGDVVVARRNDRHLRLSDGEWVTNRDRFVVTATNGDGSMAVRALDRGGEAVLPAGYVSEHVELGYASSVWSAQGRTVGTAHAIVGVRMTREALYVAATRGKESNRLYVDVEPEPANADMAEAPTGRLSAREVLVAVASRRGADISAHETMASEWARADSFEQLVKEHQSLVAVAMAERFEAVLGQAGFPDGLLARARQSPEWAGLLGALRDAEDRGLDAKDALSQLATLPISSDQDPAAVLRARLRRWEQATGSQWAPRQDLVAGLVPRATGIDDEDLAWAIRQREEAMEKRARDLAAQAVRTGERWTTPFGPPPANPTIADAWWDRLAVVAAYRDRWRITDASILGDDAGVGSLRQAAHRARARRAGQEAARLAGLVPQQSAPVPGAPSHDIGPEVGL
ncbi:MAG: relaxase domain-containing protein [Actinomycetota bacterium]|jgi:conjugative relaxase-like TrwC/TraI family protein|nr:relaxase domain-containing protein [Actinomycetota bacterium]